MKEFSFWSARFGPALRFALASLVLGVARVQSMADPASRQLWISVLAVGGLAWSIYAARAWGTCVTIDDLGVEVRNLLSRRQLAWDDVERFAVRKGRTGHSIAVVRTTAGAEIAIHGIRSDLLFHSPGQAEAIETIVSDLNRELLRERW